MIPPTMTADPIELELMRNLFEAAAEEMGITLRRVAFSANIKERRDFSCAVVDAAGEAPGAAAHMPRPLGRGADRGAAVLLLRGVLRGRRAAGPGGAHPGPPRLDARVRRGRAGGVPGAG